MVFAQRDRATPCGRDRLGHDADHRVGHHRARPERVHRLQPLLRRLDRRRVVNQGTIAADVSGGTITVYGTGNQNAGEPHAALNGATLSIQGTLTNTATVSVDSTSVLSSVAR